MALPTQPTFPGVPSGESLARWAEKWLQDHHYGEKRFHRETLRREMLEDLPFRYHPKHEELLRAWWTGRFRDVMRPLGILFIDGRAGESLVVQTAMPFDELADYCIDLLRHARVDIEAVAKLLAQWNEDTQAGIDVTATLAAWKQAAGL